METYVKKIGDVIIKRVTPEQPDDGSVAPNSSILQPPPGEPPPPPIPSSLSPQASHEYADQTSPPVEGNELNYHANEVVNGVEPTKPSESANEQSELEENITHDDSEDDVDIDDDEDDDVDVLRGLKQGDSEVAQVIEPEDLLREVKTEPCDELMVDNEATIDETEDDNMDSGLDNNEDVERSEGLEDEDMHKRKDHDESDDDGNPSKKKKSDELGDSEKDKKKSVAINFRKNIREVMDENQLDEATLAAQRQEMERLRRVQDQQKYMREAQRQMQQISRQSIKSQSRVMSLFSGNSGASITKTQAAGTAQQPGTVVMKLGSGGPPQALNKKVLEAIRGSSSRSSTPTPQEVTSSGSPNSWPSANLSSRMLNKPHMVTPSVSIAPVKPGSVSQEKKDVVTISSSSDEDEVEGREKKLAASTVGVSMGTQPDASTPSDAHSVSVGVGVGVGTGDDDEERPIGSAPTQEDDEDDCIVISEPSDEEDEEDVDPQNSGMHTNDMFNCPDEQGRVLINVGKPENEPDIFLPPQIARVIKPHQIGGVRFLFDNVVESLERFNNSTGFGCILAHSMGLGKTLQVVSFCDVFLRNTPAKTVMCIMPINTLQNWMAEFNLWLPVDPMSTPLASQGEVRPRNFQIFLLNDLHKTIASRAKVVQEWSNTGGVLLIGYEMYRQLSLKRPGRVRKGRKRMQEEDVDDVKNKPLLERMHEALVKPGPDLVICDEGHRIKNSHASISHALKQIRTKRRIVLTGYPLQNNLLEYWCMVDFVRPNYLGTKTEFSNMFERPIQNGQCIDSTPQDIRLMRYRAHVLHSLLEGFVQRRSHAVLRNSLPQKEEYVMLVRLSSLQRKLYDKFMNEVVRTKAVPNPLKAFAVCCKIWNHPDILYHFIKKREMDELQDLDLEEAASLNNAAGHPHNRLLDPSSPRGRGPKEKKGKGVKKAQAVAVPIKPATVAAVPPIEVKKEPQYCGWNADGVGGRNEGFGQQTGNYYAGYQNEYNSQQAQPTQSQHSQDGGYNYPGGQKSANYGDYYQGGNYNFYPGNVKKEEDQQVFKNESQKQTFSQMRNLSGGEVVYNRQDSGVKKEFPFQDVNMQWRPPDGQQQSQSRDSAQQQCFQPQFDGQKSTNASYQTQQHFAQPPAQPHFSAPDEKSGRNEQYQSLDSYGGANSQQPQQQQHMFDQYQSNHFPSGQQPPVDNSVKVENQQGYQQPGYSNAPQNNGPTYDQFQSQPPSSLFPAAQQPQAPQSYPSSETNQGFQSNFNQPTYTQNDATGQNTTHPPAHSTPASRTPNAFGSLNPIQSAEPQGQYEQTQPPFGVQKQEWPNGSAFNQPPAQQPSDSHAFSGYQQNDGNQKNCNFQQINYDSPQFQKNQNYESPPQQQPQQQYMGQFSQQERDFSMQNQTASRNYNAQSQQLPANNSVQSSYQGELQELTSSSFNNQSTTPGFNQSSYQPFNQPSGQPNFIQTQPEQNFPQTQPQQNFSQTQGSFSQSASQTNFNNPTPNFNPPPPQPGFNQNQAQTGFAPPQNFDQPQQQDFGQPQPQSNFNQQSQQSFSQTSQPNYAQAQSQNFSSQSQPQNYNQSQSSQNFHQSQSQSYNQPQSQSNFSSDQTTGSSHYPSSQNYEQQVQQPPPPPPPPIYQNCSYPREAPSGQSSSSWSDYFDSSAPSSASSSAQQSSSSYNAGYTQSQTASQSTSSNSSNSHPPYYNSSSSQSDSGANSQQTTPTQQQFSNQINPSSGNYYNKSSNSYYQNYEGNYQMSGPSGSAPQPPPQQAFKEKRGMSCQTEFEGDDSRKDVGVDQMSKDEEKEKKSESVGTSCMPIVKNIKEEMGIPYDWATELLKGYVPGDIGASAKMAIFFCILEESIALGDRILVFSQSLFTLNLMEELLQQQQVPGKEEKWARNVNYYRLDGSTTAIEREKLINEFNSNPKLHLFLVSTRAGSLGINLVGANRVIVFDASWNPCHDTQAVCRVYRYGQKKPCFVYRLVTDHCLEKKIYDRQINKQGMSDRVVDECNPEAHLSIKEVTSLCWDDKIEDDSPKDFTSIQDNYIDVVIQKVLQRHSSLLSKEPFQHESLLVDRKEKKLSSAEKRLAKRSYEMEKQASTSGNTRPVYPISMINPQIGLPRTGPHKPMASVRPMQSEMGNQMGRDNRPRGWIPASVWQRQGMSAQEMTLPLDVVIPTNSPDRASIVLKAGQKVMVLKSPKGIYMQLENGKIIAIRTNFKMGGKEKGSGGGGGSETTPPPQQPPPATPPAPQQNKKPSHHQQQTMQQQQMTQPQQHHHHHHQDGASPPQSQHHNQRMPQHSIHDQHHHHHPAIPTNLRNSPAVSITPRGGEPRPSPPMPFSQGNRPVRAVGPTNRPLTSSVTLTKKRVDNSASVTSPYEAQMGPQSVALPPHNVGSASGHLGHPVSSHHKQSRVAAAPPSPMAPTMPSYGGRSYGGSSQMMPAYSREVSITPYSPSSPMNDSSALHQQNRMHHQNYGKDVMQPSPAQMSSHRHHPHSASRFNAPHPPAHQSHSMPQPLSTSHGSVPPSPHFRVPPTFPSKEVSITPFSTKPPLSSSRPPPHSPQHSPSTASTSHSPGRASYMTSAPSDMMDVSKVSGGSKERSGKEKIGFQPYNSSGPTGSSSVRSELHHAQHHLPPVTAQPSPLPPTSSGHLGPPPPSPRGGTGYDLTFPPSSYPPPPNPFTVAAASSSAVPNPFYPPPPQFLPPPSPHMPAFPTHFPATSHR